MEKKKRRFRIRRWMIQSVCTLAANGNLRGFATGSIYQGPGKHVCVPGLNCYSCPGALGACPIGALQTSLAARNGLAFYATGTLLLFGVLLGRLVCGFVCPFGFLQDLLKKITKKSLTVPRGIDRPLRYVKYAVLLVLVLLLPVLVKGDYGAGVPYFCKWLCPAGTLEGGIPLVLAHETLRQTVGFQFFWKVGLLLATLALSVAVARPFCKYLCPLGAIYGLMNRLSLYRMRVDKAVCTNCGACKRACMMCVDVTKDSNSPECIRCGACKDACPHHAISSGFGKRDGPFA